MSIMPDELTPNPQVDNPPDQIPSHVAEGGYAVSEAATLTYEQIQEYIQAQAQIPEGSMLVYRTQGGQQAQDTQPQEGAEAQGTREQEAQSTSAAQSMQAQSALTQRMGMESMMEQLRRELRQATRKGPKQSKGSQQGQHRGDNAASAGRSRFSDGLEM